MAGVLSGLRVVELAQEIAGPYVTKLPGDLGADVLKIEEPGGDPARSVGPFAAGEPGAERSILFLQLNTSKRGVRLNTATPDGARLLAGLVSRADLFVTDCSPGQLADIGVDTAALVARWPSLVLLSVTPFGGHGPYRDRRSAPLTTFHGSGEGYADGPPAQIRVGGDIIVGVHGGFPRLAALVHRQATGQGVHIDLSSVESQSSLIGESILEYLINGDVPRRRGNREPMAVPHNCFRCRGTDAWVSIAVRTDEEWRGLVAAMGAPVWTGDSRFATASGRDLHADEIEELVAAWTAGLTADEVTTCLQAAAVPAAPSHRAPELFSRVIVATLTERGDPYADAAAYRYVAGRLYFRIRRGTPTLEHLRRDGKMCCVVASKPTRSSYYAIKEAMLHGGAVELPPGEQPRLRAALGEINDPVEPGNTEGPVFSVGLDDMVSFPFDKIKGRYQHRSVQDLRRTAEAE